MAEYHRKIELQSPEDFQYLISNIRRAASEKIDKDLPPIEGEDKMRRRVEELMHDYLTTVFQTTAENITINGLSPSPELLSSIINNTTSTNKPIEEYETLNSKLFQRAKELARQEEDLIEEIAALRRNMPGVSVDSAKGAYKEAIEGDDLKLRAAWEKVQAQEKEAVVFGLGPLERQEAVERSWDKGIKGLEKLKRTMPETVAKKERAERAENYVLAPEPRA